jgi:transmembrane sensor
MENMQTDSLFEKLVNRNLSGEELKQLAAYFEEKTPQGETDKYFLRIWDQCHKYNSELQSDILLCKIQQKLDIKPDITKNPKNLQVLVNLLKYAAVFIAAFAFSWFINNQFKKQYVTGRTNYTGSHEVMVSLGSKSRIRLPDGSVVNLNSGSKLTYPAFFSDKNRHVNLEGEAYFDVTADSSRPFFVHTSDITIKVIGTSFNVKSYPESNTIETTLVSGSLEISDKTVGDHGMRNLNKNLILKPHQKAVYIKDLDKLTLDDREELKLETNRTKSPRLSIQDQIDIQPLTAWKDNKLVFNNEKFEDLAVKLERWYNVKITIKSHSLKKERFTGTFENETTEQVLNALKIAEPFEYSIDKNEIIIFDSRTTH